MKRIQVYLVLLLMIAQINSQLIISSGKKNFEETSLVTNDATINVVASLSIVADIAAQVGEGLFTVESIVSGTEDPHTYEPSPSEIEKVAEADIFIRFGLEGLEPWVQSVLDANPGLNVLNLINSSMIKFDDLIGVNNPHVWMDPNNVKMMVGKISQRVSLLDPINILTYETNRDNYLNELDSLLNRINQTKTIFEGMKVIVHHPSFKYLFDLLGIIRVGAIEEQEGVEPSPEHIQEVISTINSENVSLIVNQPQLEDETVNQIALDTGIQIVDLTPLLGVYEINDYISMIEYNLLALQNPFDPPTTLLPWTTWLLVGIAGGALVSLGIAIIVVRRKNPRN